ncbi:MAG TPA: Uma2 family endonuclease [Chitinophagaceae bacterium]|nr:Uma2 family endonuclease [Chitinophagaceae bacterium]
MITSLDQLDLTKEYTYADYLTWQFNDRVELIKGKIFKMSPAPLRSHQHISFALALQIGKHIENKTCEAYTAPFDVRLVNKRKSTPDNHVTSVVQPDICVICDKTKLDEKGCIGAPDWIIEILSPGNNKKEMKDKFDLYEENGVKEYWVVYPEYIQVQVFDLVDDRFSLRGTYINEKIPVKIFEDFSIDTSTIFKM